MKTGYTEASGHNLVTSAVRSGVRLIGVVLGAGSEPRARRPHGDAARPGLRADGRSARAPDHRGEPDAQPGRLQRMPRRWRPADPSGRATRGTTAAWTIQVGSFGSERAAREAASSARRAADGGEVRIEPASLRRQDDLARSGHRTDGGRGAGRVRRAGAASVGVHRAASRPAAGRQRLAGGVASDGDAGGRLGRGDQRHAGHADEQAGLHHARQSD